MRTSKVTGKTAKPLSPGNHTFEVSLQSGTRWQFVVDGKSQGNYNMAAADAPPQKLLATSENNDGSIQANFLNFQMRRNGVWLAVPTAGAEVIRTYEFDPPAIGVAGNAQDGAIPSGAVRIGGGLGVISNGVTLW
jgi:hypothetical protein